MKKNIESLYSPIGFPEYKDIKLEKGLELIFETEIIPITFNHEIIHERVGFFHTYYGDRIFLPGKTGLKSPKYEGFASLMFNGTIPFYNSQTHRGILPHCEEQTHLLEKNLSPGTMFLGKGIGKPYILPQEAQEFSILFSKDTSKSRNRYSLA